MQRRQRARASWLRLALILALALPLALAGSLLLAPPTHADGDTLSLEIAGDDTYAYGSCVALRATIHLAVGLKENLNPDGLFAWINFSEGQRLILPGYGILPDALTFVNVGCISKDGAGTPFVPGTYTAYATFTNPDTGDEVTSDSVSFTVTKGTPTLDCGNVLHLPPVTPNSPLTAKITLSGQIPPVGDRFTFTFKGPVTVTTATLTSDVSGEVTYPAPSERGRYTVSCHFLGDTRYVPASAKLDGSLLVTLDQQLGGATLTTNPNPLEVGQPAELDITLEAAPGGPTPTGFLNVKIGDFQTGFSIRVGADGAALVKLDSVPPEPTPPTIVVIYGGDSYYASATFTFPWPAPPTPTATAASATATATADAASGASGASATAGNGARNAGGGVPLWLLVALGLLVVAGASGSGIYLLRRRRSVRITIAPRQ